MAIASTAVRQEVFEGQALKVVEQEGEEWFLAEDIGKALGYDLPRINVLKIYHRSRDEFEGLVRVVNLTTRSKDGRARFHKNTVFNAQGAYLLAILARTPKSKALRRWLSQFMARDLEALRRHVRTLESEAQRDRETIHKLHGQVGGTTAALNAAREKLAAALAAGPQPAGPDEAPEMLPPSQENPIYWVNGKDLVRVAWIACEVDPEFVRPWYARVKKANNYLQYNWDIVLTAVPALLNLMHFADLMPPLGSLQKLLDKGLGPQLKTFFDPDTPNP